MLNLLEVELINFTFFVITEISKFQDKLKKIMFVTLFFIAPCNFRICGVDQCNFRRTSIRLLIAIFCIVQYSLIVVTFDILRNSRRTLRLSKFTLTKSGSRFGTFYSASIDDYRNPRRIVGRLPMHSRPFDCYRNPR